MPEESFPQELLLVSEQDCQDPRKICEGLIRSKERKDEGGVRVRTEKDKMFRTTVAQRKSKCARVISLLCFLFLSFTFHLRPRVFSRKSAIPLEHNFPDIRSTGFRFRFLFCASYVSASSSICLSSPEHMR